MSDLKVNQAAENEIEPENFQGLYSLTMGAGTPAILVHGLGASMHDWDVLMPELASYAYQATAVDLFGHGESPKPDQPDLYTLPTVFDSFEIWLEKQEFSGPISLVGHSLGGHLCLLYTLKHPEQVRCLVLIDPLFCPGQISPILRLLNRRPRISMRALQVVPLKLIDTILGWDPINAAQFSPQTRYQIALDYKRASPYILNIPKTIHDLTARLYQINIPALIIWGNRDLTLDPRSFSNLVKHLPLADGHMISDCGHQPHIGKPVLVNRKILDFLNTHNDQPLPAPVYIERDAYPFM